MMLDILSSGLQAQVNTNDIGTDQIIAGAKNSEDNISILELSCNSYNLHTLQYKLITA